MLLHMCSFASTVLRFPRIVFLGVSIEGATPPSKRTQLHSTKARVLANPTVANLPASYELWHLAHFRNRIDGFVDDGKFPTTGVITIP
jgi:hypothetical protein